MTIDTNFRSQEAEIMDDLDMKGDELRKTLDQIATINRFLGGNRLTLNGVRKLLINIPKNQQINILDVGCGNGDMLRDISEWAVSEQRTVKLEGIDANADTINHARNLSTHYTNIRYYPTNLFSQEFSSFKPDIIICTLTLHHFSDEEIVSILERFRKQAKMGLVINDLQRSALAYRLFQLVCLVFPLGKMPKNDGLISILRGFKRKELRNFSKKLNFNTYSIRWKWAFRYQWIISFI
ncbi:methyltransferase domain-containing protein [Flavobacterium sp. SE-s28]|uniref:Methyltransferase domain-containing protein n=1 Tax=Flavobacterium silvaticum TaxID=1852020 RepID=A0A972FNJ2_9FLAO|nr:methyltransferase domain-containing protein [Flavobacterium silvaticum]